MKKKILAAVMAATMVFSLVACGSSDAGSNAATGSANAATGSANAATESASAGTTSSSSSGDMIKVGIINNDPNESGYRTANDKDMKNTFTEANGYEASFAYSLKNDEQITAAQKFIQDGVDYLLLSAADTAGWDSVLKDAQDAGIRVILFDRTIDADESLYEASIVSDMAKEGQTAVDWLKSQNLSEYNIIHLQGVMGSAAQQGRTGALDDAAANDGFNLVTQQTGLQRIPHLAYRFLCGCQGCHSLPVVVLRLFLNVIANLPADCASGMGILDLFSYGIQIIPDASGIPPIRILFRRRLFCLLMRCQHYPFFFLSHNQHPL